MSTFTAAPAIPNALHVASAPVGETSSSAVEMNPNSALDAVANGKATHGAAPPPGSRSPADEYAVARQTAYRFAMYRACPPPCE